MNGEVDGGPSLEGRGRAPRTGACPRELSGPARPDPPCTILLLGLGGPGQPHIEPKLLGGLRRQEIDELLGA